MQIGFVGLGKMGGNMVHRIKRDSDHDVVAFDFSEEAVAKAEEHGAVGASSPRGPRLASSNAPRAVWVMVPAGDPTTETVLKLGELLEEGDLVIDGGNSKWHEDKGRADELVEKGINYVDVGTSGGVWGLDVGYCMMVGGTDDGVEHPQPDPRRARSARRLAPLRPAGRRALREDGPQRRRVRDDAGLRRGLRADAQVGVPDRARGGRRPVEPRLASSAPGCASWPRTPSRPRATTSRTSAATSADSGEGRWTLVDSLDLETPMPVLSAAIAARFYSRGEGDYTAQGALRAAQPVRRARR